jgi:hypothetical protein
LQKLYVLGKHFLLLLNLLLEWVRRAAATALDLEESHGDKVASAFQNSLQALLDSGVKPFVECGLIQS